MREMPLHARVAAALGCDLRVSILEVRHGEPNRFLCLCLCADSAPPHEQRQPAHGRYGPRGPEVFRYDTDWNATGPLFDRLCWGTHRMTDDETWIAIPHGPYAQGDHGTGATPLIAVCNLILRLHAVGRLAARLEVPA